MALSEAKKAADKRHNAKLDQIMIRPYKEKGAEIRRAAKASGMSIQAYILEAVQMRMDREAGLTEQPVPRGTPVQTTAAGQQTEQFPGPDAPIERRVPLERLGTEVLKLDVEESGSEILRLERAASGVNLMMLFCNMTADERAEWKRRRTEAYNKRKSLLPPPVPNPRPKMNCPYDLGG